jgi:hypothetical protein
MKVILDIKDDKAAFIMELLNNFKFVKAEPLSPYKTEVISGIRQAVSEMKQIQEGTLKGISAKELLNEL